MEEKLKSVQPNITFVLMYFQKVRSKNVNFTRPCFLKECVRMRKYGSMYYAATHYKLR